MATTVLQVERVSTPPRRATTRTAHKQTFNHFQRTACSLRIPSKLSSTEVSMSTHSVMSQLPITKTYREKLKLTYVRKCKSILLELVMGSHEQMKGDHENINQNI